MQKKKENAKSQVMLTPFTTLTKQIHISFTITDTKKMICFAIIHVIMKLIDFMVQAVITYPFRSICECITTAKEYYQHLNRFLESCFWIHVNKKCLYILGIWYYLHLNHWINHYLTEQLIPIFSLPPLGVGVTLYDISNISFFFDKTIKTVLCRFIILVVVWNYRGVGRIF